MAFTVSTVETVAGGSSVNLPCIIWVEKALYRFVPMDFNGQDHDMDVKFATDSIGVQL